MTDREHPSGFDAQLARVLGGRDRAGLGPCPDAETLAAWTDGTLDAAARTDCAAHLADCMRCQAILAAADLAWEREDQAVGAEAAPEAARARAARFPWRKIAWVSAPLALAASALLAVWVSRGARERPAETPREETPEATKVAGGIEPERDRQPPAGQDAFRRDRAKGPEAAAKGERADRPASPPAQPTGPAPGESRQVASSEAPSVEPARDAAASRVAAAPVMAPAAAPPPPPALQRAAENAMAAPTLKSAVTTQWSSPSGRVTWSTAPGGRLLRAAGGAAPELIATTGADLVSGAAFSDEVAWVVGKQGTVWRTTDGRSWRQVQFPTSDDLVAVEPPGGADTVTVTTAEGRRFTTRDGGRSWQ